MKYKKYPEYKDSCINFINKIPNHWNEIRLKFIGYLYGGLSGKSSNDFNQFGNTNNKKFIPFTNIANNLKIDKKNLQEVIVLENEKQNQVEKGDLFFLMSSENYDDVGLASVLLNDIEGTYLNSFCKGFRITKKNISPNFINYQLRSNILRHNLLIGANGFTRINLRIGKVNDLCIILPPLSEQKIIASFLDKKTAQIDKYIEKRKRFIKLLQEKRIALINHAVTKGLNPDVKMKDSGIEWIGEIPEVWEIKKLRYLGTCQNGISKSGESFGYGYPFVSYSDVYKNEIIPIEVNGLVDSTEKEQIIYSVEEGDVFFTRTSETIEEIGIVSVCFITIPKAVFAGFLIRFRQNLKKLFNSYSKYYFMANMHRQYFVKKMNIVTRASLSQELLKNLPVLLPPLEEQKIIAEYLDKKTSQIDTLITKTQKQIDLLTEYRTALISNAVTGKIDVRDYLQNISEDKINPYLLQLVLAAHIISQLHKNKTFGHVKFQKILYLCEYYGEITDINSNYHRDVAGPYDKEMIRSLDKNLEKQNWFKAIQDDNRWYYIPLEKSDEYKEHYTNIFKIYDEKINTIINLCKSFDTQRCEIIATLFAGWNDLIIKGKNPTDDDIIDEVLYNWHKSKQNIQKDRWQNALKWMKKNDIIPTGFGKPTNQ